MNNVQSNNIVNQKDVEKILNSLPKEKKDKLLRFLTLKIQHSEEFHGPIPPPDLFAKYEQILPGSADRILRMAENQQEHRMQLENKIMTEQLSMSKRGQMCALVVFILGLGISVLFAYFGMKWFAGTFATVTLVTIIGLFINGKKSINRNLRNKKM